MTFSDALPIKFWLPSELTYNETEVCGINPACWCQPWNLADSVILQFLDSSSPGEFMVGVFDDDDYMVDAHAFTEASGVHSVTMNFLAIGQYSLKIFAASALQYLLDADTWTESHAFTSRTANTFVKSTGATGIFLSAANQPLAVADGGTVEFVVTVTITGTWTGTVVVAAGISPNGVIDAPTLAERTFTSNVAAQQLTFRLRASGGAATMLQIQVSGNLVTVPGTFSITLEIDSQSALYYVNPNLIEAKSDCMDVRVSHDCSKLMLYSNGSDYAGLKYTTLGNPVFYVRVPSVFFHEEFSEESEEHELSDDTMIETYSKIIRKKKLEIGFVPYYFHLGMKLRLAHHLVQIDDAPWIKRDAYEIDPGSNRYPLKKAAVLLTDKNFIKRNLL